MTDFDPPDNDEPGYSLVMPFVVCESVGGPYADAAFVAGARFGQISMALKTLRPYGIPEYQVYVEPALIPQLDLLAMHEKWRVEFEPWEEHPDEWVLATFESLPE